MRCLIIDDDPVIRELVSDYIAKVDFLEFGIKVANAIDALNLLNIQAFELIFLDINMPEMSGVEFLDNIDASIPVIMITADKDFALDAYNYNVVDYLVKPISYSRFYQAVKKVQDHLAKKETTTQNDEIFVKDGHDLVKLNLREVLYIEAVSNYVSFKTQTKNVLSLLSMKKLEDNLPDYFVRIHRSYIVNIRKVDKVESNNLLIGSITLPVSSSYKQALLDKLNLMM